MMDKVFAFNQSSVMICVREQKNSFFNELAVLFFSSIKIAIGDGKR